jgi:hypothetical protein
MSIKYDSKREPLAEIIRKATVNATYVIPDLQRPYASVFGDENIGRWISGVGLSSSRVW